MGVRRAPLGFAVVDFETTGINPAQGDRAVEVGVVHVAVDGTIEDEAETLIRVHRDLGSRTLHHIHAAELMDAPDFAGIAAELRDMLDGYVFVAHNAFINSRFLHAEYGRLGYVIPVDRASSICTLRLSNRYLGLRSLEDCCAELGIRNADAHSALGDAHAAALLLGGFLHGMPDWEGWRPALERAAEQEWPRIDEKRRPWVPRQSHTASRRPASDFLDRLQSGNPAAAQGALEDEQWDAAAEYIGLLDMCLTDARLSDHERSALTDMAKALRLSTDDRRRIHENYFADIAQEAWIDGTITDREARELREVGALLSIDPRMVDYALTDQRHAVATGRHARHTPDRVTAFDGRRLGTGSAYAGTGDAVRDSADDHGAHPPAVDLNGDAQATTTDRRSGDISGDDSASNNDGATRKQRTKRRKRADDGVTLGKTIKRRRHDGPLPGEGSGSADGLPFQLRRGDRVVLAGPLRRPYDEWVYLLEGMGLLVWPTVTDQVRLVVSPRSDDSPRTRMAEEHGVPVVDEQWLEQALDAGLVV